ncbi:MAG: NUDIX hydrolase [bacterium]
MTTEKVMVVATAEVFKNESWQGLKTDGIDTLLKIIQERHSFLSRHLVEDDPSWQQIIPYIVFRYNHSYLLVKRLEHSAEHRLHHQYSLGLGGHINLEDTQGANPVEAGLWREWAEEVSYEGGLSHSLVGFINDDSREVSRVHLGLFYLFEGYSSLITVLEDHEMIGQLLSLSEIEPFYDKMESWSQIVYDYLKRL